MTPLDRLRELEPKATPGPWEPVENPPGQWMIEGPSRFIAEGLQDSQVCDLGYATRPENASNAAFIVELRNTAPHWLTLEALARDEHHKRCGCAGEACKLGEVLRVLDGGETEPAESSGERNVIPEHMREDFDAMVAQMRDPEAGACSCGFPQKPCLRIMFRNGPPFPARPCEPV